MAKYLLASASGASFLCLINGLLPVQALANSVPIDNNSLVNVPQTSVIINSKVSAAETKLILADGSQPEAPAIKGEPEVQDSSASNESQTSDNNDSAQVTSVSQLSDVQPTDWAFQALRVVMR
ncbi:MAG: S-layer protein, partial [Nostoc sp. TH1S01]|nr:S-layer protein [Nostoc sp. TH1S01]